ncbi:hypothetical protein [Phreatobacter stygius]|nr:hypothetical protein [Phreatobacter stygius]
MHGSCVVEHFTKEQIAEALAAAERMHPGIGKDFRLYLACLDRNQSEGFKLSARMERAFEDLSFVRSAKYPQRVLWVLLDSVVCKFCAELGLPAEWSHIGAAPHVDEFTQAQIEQAKNAFEKESPGFWSRAKDHLREQDPEIEETGPYLYTPELVSVSQSLDFVASAADPLQEAIKLRRDVIIQARQEAGPWAKK